MPTIKVMNILGINIRMPFHMKKCIQFMIIGYWISIPVRIPWH